jgi:hypothetical protein
MSNGETRWNHNTFVSTLILIKENNHQQMNNVYYYIHYKNFLHVSTPPGHLQGEQSLN